MSTQSHRTHPQVPLKGHYTNSARASRLQWVEEFCETILPHLGENPVDASQLTGNIENYLGTVAIPLGIAGPLLFTSPRVSGWRLIPMATTEGALVASTSRGATALSRSGGVRTMTLGQRIQRVPLFAFDDLFAAAQFCDWIDDHHETLCSVTEEVSSHAKLIETRTTQLGRQVHVSFVYETAEAAGQNMTTACTWHAVQWIQRRLEFTPFTPTHVQIEANLSGDKKMTGSNLVLGRGTRVIAEAVLPADIVRHVLKIEPQLLARSHAMMTAGAFQSAMVGFVGNTSNLIAAVFAATGQDIACVVESSAGILQIEPDGNDLYAALTLPSLVVGTVGGGTHLPHQQECLRITQCSGDGSALQLAEVIGGFALGLDLSLCAALATNQFATAHERLGRNRPTVFLAQSEITTESLTSMIHAITPAAPAVIEFEPLTSPISPGIITELGSNVVGRKHVGMHPLRLRFNDDSTQDCLLKIKATDREVLVATAAMAALLGPDLAGKWRENYDHLGFIGLHTRELGLACLHDDSLDAVRPRTLGIWRDDDREIAALIIEFLGTGTRLLDQADQTGAWNDSDIHIALRDIARVHASWWNRVDELTSQDWFGPVPLPHDHGHAEQMYRDVITHAADEYPDWFPPERVEVWKNLLTTHEASRIRSSRRPQTLVHHDFNPRNTAIRTVNGIDHLVAWDWELATSDIFGRDVAEFCAFAFTPKVTIGSFETALETHLRALHDHGIEITQAEHRSDVADGLHTFACTRLLQYLLVNEVRDFKFLGPLIETTHRLIEFCKIDSEPELDIRAVEEAKTL